MLRCPPGSARFPYTTLFRSDVGQDRPLEVLRAGERAALEAAPAQQREPALDQVKPGRAGWCKMQVELWALRSEEHTSELQSPCNLVCRLLLVQKKTLTTVQP